MKIGTNHSEEIASASDFVHWRNEFSLKMRSMSHSSSVKFVRLTNTIDFGGISKSSKVFAWFPALVRCKDGGMSSSKCIVSFNRMPVKNCTTLCTKN